MAADLQLPTRVMLPEGKSYDTTYYLNLASEV